AGEEEERTGADGGDRHDVEGKAHSPGPSGASGDPGVPFLTNAMEANIARSASVNARSAAAVAPVAVPAMSSAAMPPVPTSCAAIIRSVFPGPRSTRNSPTAIIATTKPEAAIRKSYIVGPTECPPQDGFIRGELRHDRLLDVQAMVHQPFAVIACGNGSREQARERGEDVSRRPGGKTHGVDDEAGTHGKTRIHHTSRDVPSGDHGLPQEAQHQRRNGHGTQAQ